MYTALAQKSSVKKFVVSDYYVSNNSNLHKSVFLTAAPDKKPITIKPVVDTVTMTYDPIKTNYIYNITYAIHPNANKIVEDYSASTIKNFTLKTKSNNYFYTKSNNYFYFKKPLSFKGDS